MTEPQENSPQPEGLQDPPRGSSGNTDFAPSPDETGEAPALAAAPPESQPTQPMKSGRLEMFGPFSIEEKVGEGGMGVVYRAFDPGLQRQVAIKKIQPRLAGAEEYAQRFLAEARSVAAVIHPNVAQIFSIHASDAEHPPYFVMEFVDGESAEARLERDGPLSFETAIDFILQAARGLQAAYHKGIVHRDIKPSNLLINRRDELKLVDFGLARQIADLGSLTEVGVVLGTPHYVSPEQGRGHRVDHRSDIYSLGCTLYFLLTGQELFQGQSKMDVIVSHAKDAPPRVVDSRASTPAIIDQILARMLEKDPEDRYPGYDELIAHLATARRVISETPSRAWRWRLLAAGLLAPLMAWGGFELKAYLDRGPGDRALMLRRLFGDLYAPNDDWDVLDFDYTVTNVEKQRHLQRFIRVTGASEGDSRLPYIYDGLRWRSHDQPITFPYLKQLSQLELFDLEFTGDPDFELVIGYDPLRPDDFLRIYFSVGGRRNPRIIEVRRSGEEIPVQMLDPWIDPKIPAGQRIDVRVTRKNPNVTTKPARFTLEVFVRVAGEKRAERLNLAFEIDQRHLPCGQIALRAEGNQPKWTVSIGKVRIEGIIDETRTRDDLLGGY